MANSHKNREVRLDLKCEEPSEAAFAAFYADCVHEVLPVTSGCRLAVVFNLLRKGKGPKPEPPSYAAEQVRVTALLGAWAGAKRGGDEGAPDKLIYPLEHAYTPAELGFDKLKRADAAVANVLVAAAPQAGCDLHLALVSIEESGTAEYAGGYGSRRSRWSLDDEFEAGEVCDRDARLSGWRRPDGTPSALGALPVEEEELCPPDAFDDVEPDGRSFTRRPAIKVPRSTAPTGGQLSCSGHATAFSPCSTRRAGPRRCPICASRPSGGRHAKRDNEAALRTLPHVPVINPR